MRYTIAFFQYGKTLIDPLKFIHNHSGEFETLAAAQAYGTVNSETNKADGFQVRRKGHATREVIIKAHSDA
jgi:hypothetical protein